MFAISNIMFEDPVEQKEEPVNMEKFQSILRQKVDDWSSAWAGQKTLFKSSWSTFSPPSWEGLSSTVMYFFQQISCLKNDFFFCNNTPD